MTTEEILAQVLSAVGPYLILVLGTLASLLCAYVTRLVRERLRNEQARAALDRLSDEVLSVVAELQQTMVKQLKVATEDGKLTKEDGSEALDAALTKVKMHLGKGGLDALKRVVQSDLDAFIRTRIEAAVHKQGSGVCGTVIGACSRSPSLPPCSLPAVAAGAKRKSHD